jgi:hypothetical protein
VFYSNTSFQILICRPFCLLGRLHHSPRPNYATSQWIIGDDGARRGLYSRQAYCRLSHLTQDICQQNLPIYLTRCGAPNRTVPATFLPPFFDHSALSHSAVNITLQSRCLESPLCAMPMWQRCSKECLCYFQLQRAVADTRETNKGTVLLVRSKPRLKFHSLTEPI